MLATTRLLNNFGWRHGPSCEATLRVNLSHVAARRIGVLLNDGVAHGGDRHLIRSQTISIDPDVDRSTKPATMTTPQPCRRSRSGFYDLIRELGNLSN